MTARLRGESPASAGQARVAIWLSLLAMAAAIVSLILLGDKLRELSRRVASLEARPLPTPAPPPAPREPPPETQETARESEQRKIRELTEKEGQDHLDVLVTRLDLDSEKEAKFRTAFSDEFGFYADGVMRAFEDLKKHVTQGEINWLESPEFRKGLEERIAATDEAVKPMLDPAQTAKFEEWRKSLRKTRYELE